MSHEQRIPSRAGVTASSGAAAFGCGPVLPGSTRPVTRGRSCVGGKAWPLSDAAVVGNLHLAPARPVFQKREIVREVGGVGHGERVGREELRGGDRALPPASRNPRVRAVSFWKRSM